MDLEREGGRGANQLRPIDCTRNVLSRAHGSASCSHGKSEKEFEMILKRTLQNICLLTVHPNTTTSIIVQVVHDDGSLLPCAIHAACAALVDAGIPLKYLAENEGIRMSSFPKLNSVCTFSRINRCRRRIGGHGVITSLTHGVMP
ncbi:Exosome complex exonuclease RRP46, partial [Sesamum angolense]